jgi:SAM-dependent methyltransferase
MVLKKVRRASITGNSAATVNVAQPEPAPCGGSRADGSLKRVLQVDAMGLYSKYILPRVIHFTCGLKPNRRQREKVVPRARGRVLEVGIGSGLNLPFYDSSKVTKVWGLDPSRELTRIAERTARSLDLEVEFISLAAGQIPLDDASVDTVLVTYTLCSIPETPPALRQMARVLRRAVSCSFASTAPRLMRACAAGRIVSIRSGSGSPADAS